MGYPDWRKLETPKKKKIIIIKKEKKEITRFIVTWMTPLCFFFLYYSPLVNWKIMGRRKRETEMK